MGEATAAAALGEAAAARPLLLDHYLGQKYKLRSSECFEEYLKFLGIGLLSRKAAVALSPAVVLRRSGAGYTLTMTTSLKTIELTFHLDQQFEETRADGVKVQCVCTANENRLIQTQTEENGRRSTHVREFTRDALVVTSTAEGWNGKCVRIYEAAV